RCYQILVSPSSIVEHVKSLDLDQRPSLRHRIEALLPLKLRTTLYSFALQEGYISISERGLVPVPAAKIKVFCRKYINSWWVLALFAGTGLGLALWQGHTAWNHLLAYLFGALDLVISLQCLISLEN